MSQRNDEQTLSTQIRERLRNEIIQKKLPAGMHISVKSIADRYGVSRMPVREAIQALSGERLLEINPYKGATVLQIDREYINYSNDLLAAIESLFSEDLVTSLDAEKISRLREINREIGRLQDKKSITQSYTALNNRFHALLHSVVSNRLAVEAYNRYHEILLAVRLEYSPDPERVLQVVEEHEDILRAVELKNARQVESAVYLHSMKAKMNYMKSFSAKSV